MRVLVTTDSYQPILDAEQLQAIFDTALTYLDKDLDVSVNINWLNADDIRQINKKFRNTDKQTNVLVFEQQLPAAIIANTGINSFGDIALCSAVIVAEAEQQNKTVKNHCIHIAIHGLLHLLGYDHKQEAEAELMENTEIKILRLLNIDNPYLEKPVPTQNN